MDVLTRVRQALTTSCIRDAAYAAVIDTTINVESTLAVICVNIVRSSNLDCRFCLCCRRFVDSKVSALGR
jgi:hypothetical protein